MRMQLAVAAAGVLMLSGCNAFTTTVTCIDYIDLSDHAVKAGVAELVFVGEVTGTDGVTELSGVDAAAHTVRIDEVLKGEFSESEIRVVSVSDPCSGKDQDYPGGDPLDRTGPAEFFLVKNEGVWTTLSPYEGAVTIGDDGMLPWDPEATPSPSPVR